MHVCRSYTSRSLHDAISHFEGYEMQSWSHGLQYAKGATLRLNKQYKSTEEASNDLIDASYWGGGDCAVVGMVKPAKVTKAFEVALKSYLTKRNEYLAFNKNLTISYGRKSKAVTCPHCGSSISLKYGGHFRRCPVCHSNEIISKSNWNILATKSKLMTKADEALKAEASKNGVMFVAGLSWNED